MKIVVLLLCMVGSLQAYTDPGTGILLWQIMLALFAGLTFKFRALIGKFFGKKEQPGENTPPVESDRN